MVEQLISNLGYGALQSDTKRQKILECVITRNSKLYLGKVYTEDQLAKLNEEEVEKLFNNYEAKLSGQMVHSLGHLIINMYSMGACAVLGISNQDALSEDLENDPFLNSALQRATCELYYRFGLFLAPLSVGIITSRHYLSERNKMENEQVEWETIKMEKMREHPSRPEVIGSFIGMGMVGFCFGIGLILAVKTVSNMKYCIDEIIIRKSGYCQ